MDMKNRTLATVDTDRKIKRSVFPWCPDLRNILILQLKDLDITFFIS